MAGYIGLWISASRVGAVRLQSGGRKMGFERAFAADYSNEESLAAALREAAARFADTGDEWTVGLPMAEFSFRQLSFPFGGHAQIAAAIGYEMEAALPFGGAELAVAFTVLSSDKRQSSVLACAIRKERLTRYRAILKNAGIEARRIAPDATGLLYFYRGVILPSLGGAEPPTALIASAEADAMHLCVTAADGFFDFSATMPDEKEIRRFAALLPAAPEKYFIGGQHPEKAGQWPGQELWKQRIETVIGDGRAERLMIPIGLAALGWAGGGEGLFFAGGARRKAKFAYDWRVAAVAGGVVLALLVGFLFLRNHLKERTLAMINNQSKTVFAAALPGVRAVKPVFQLEERLAKLEGKMKRAGLAGNGRNDLVWVLKRMSETIPENMTVEMDEIIYEEDSVVVTGRTDRLESANRLKELFSIATPFKGAELLESKTAPDGKKATFKLRMPL